VSQELLRESKYFIINIERI